MPDTSTDSATSCNRQSPCATLSRRLGDARCHHDTAVSATRVATRTATWTATNTATSTATSTAATWENGPVWPWRGYHASPMAPGADATPAPLCGHMGPRFDHCQHVATDVATYAVIQRAPYVATYCATALCGICAPQRGSNSATGWREGLLWATLMPRCYATQPRVCVAADGGPPQLRAAAARHNWAPLSHGTAVRNRCQRMTCVGGVRHGRAAHRGGG